MNSPCQIPIVIHQGEQYNPPPVSFTDNSVPPNVIPLTNYTAFLTVRLTAGNLAIVLQASTSNGQIYVNQVAGQLIINIPAATLSVLAPFAGVYDLFIIPPNNQPMYCFGGPFTVLESVYQ